MWTATVGRVIGFGISTLTSKQYLRNAHAQQSPQSIYDFTVKDIDSNDVSLSKYRGNVCLVVNVASK
jgi:glutathione peroxidase